MKYYRIRLWGYGGEGSYIKLSEEAYNYWKPICEEDDEPLMDYMLEGDSYILDEDTAPTTSVPEHADFMAWKSDDGTRYHSSWYEASDEFAHQWGVEIGSARITVEEVSSNEYNAELIREIIDGKTVDDLDPDGEIDMIDYGMMTYHGGEPVDEPEYVCQFWSSEKGIFYDGIIETEGEFDINKLILKTEEFPNGDDTVVDIMYDGESVDNQGGDTNGKGYHVHVWSNGL